MRTRLLGLFPILLFLTSFGPADDKSGRPEQSSSSSTSATFKARAELVVVPVVVTDKYGNHVSGLPKEAFVVQENGAEQKIVFFEEITTNTQRASRTKLRANTFSNELQAQGTTRRVTILLLDLLNTRFLDQKQARDAMIKSLSESLDPTEPTALYVLTRSGLKPIHDFTTDPRILIAAVKRMRSTADADAAVDSGLDSADVLAASDEMEGLQQAIDDAAENFASFQRRVAAQITLEAMQQLAKAYAGLPGRKSVIWATGSFPFSISDSSMELARAGRESLSDVVALYERTWEAINDANFAIYPVDVRGLMPSATFSAAMPSGRMAGGRTGTMGRMGPSADWALMESHTTLRAFAEATGGKAFYNSNDIAKGFRDAAKDSAGYYLLSYYLDRNRAKQGWRKLHVKVHQRGVDVRARSGFFVTDAISNPKAMHDNDLRAALTSPLDYTELPLTLALTKFSPAQEQRKQRVEYEVVVPANMAMIDESDNNHVRLEFIALVRFPDGKIAAGPQLREIEAHLKPETLQQMRRTGLRYSDSLDLSPGEYALRFVVRDSLSGRMGSVAGTFKLEETASGN